MNEHTAQLLQGLAVKLGTTSEYLWAILLKQAPVFAWISIGYYVGTLLAVLMLWTFRKRIAASLTWCINEGEGTALLCFFGLIIAGIASLIWLFACIFMFESVVTAFVNPEYWALDKVLDTVKAAKK